MSKRYIPFVMMFALILSSCSSEESTITNEEAPLLKTYKISKDAEGRYSINYELNDGAYSEITKDIEAKSNNINVFEGAKRTKKKESSNVELEEGKIKIGVFENNQQRKSITVQDENAVFAKGVDNPDFLQSYSIEFLGGNQYVLDFNVKEGVGVSFEYNDEKNIYEVHLKEGEGESRDTSFTKLYTKSQSLALKIDFVNYIKIEPQAKGQGLMSSLAYETKRSPRYGTGGKIY